MFYSKSTVLHSEGVPWIEFPKLTETGIVKNAFSTRLGGVSDGIFSAMNLSFKREDDPAKVMENYRRFAESAGLDLEKMVCSDQSHTTNIRRVDASDAGKGILRAQDYHDIDGLITDTNGLCLVTSFADCVPLYFVDPVHHAIGMSHSGWRGTAGRMGEKTVKAMQEAFDTDPADLVCAIGPSICQKCYEISKDVADVFAESFKKEQADDILLDKGNGKYQLDLWKTNRYILIDAGVRPENIAVTDICTSCNDRLLWSHRKTGGRRGGAAAFLQLIY